MGGTILARDGRRVGDNTDGAGCLMALEEELDCVPAWCTAAVLGAGGSAQPGAVGLARAGLRDLVLLLSRPEDTPLAAAARRRRCRTANGLGMPLPQGAFAFARWTGRPAPLDAMRRALRPPA